MADIVSPAEVAALLEEFGLPATWRTVRNQAIGEPWDPMQQSTVDYPCFAAVLPTERVGDETRHNVDTEQRESCSTAYISAPAGLTTPSAMDVLVVGSVTYRFKSLDLLAPAGTLLLVTAEVEEQPA